ncbi:MAG: hypothetical protein NUV82_02660 [Candidatus Komeilibacteria bacterium]|nr:hypothetical protein [Candidatus Komeilibacteria bacterium]
MGNRLQHKGKGMRAGSLHIFNIRIGDRMMSKTYSYDTATPPTLFTLAFISLIYGMGLLWHSNNPVTLVITAIVIGYALRIQWKNQQADRVWIELWKKCGYAVLRNKGEIEVVLAHERNVPRKFEVYSPAVHDAEVEQALKSVLKKADKLSRMKKNLTKIRP